MTGNGRRIVIVGILQHKAVTDKSFETVITKFRIEAVQILLAHLVDHDTHDEPGGFTI